MKKIVLKNLSPGLEHLIIERARNEHVSREEAVVAILRDAEIERAIEHDIAVLERMRREHRDSFDANQEWPDGWVKSFDGIPDDFERPAQFSRREPP